MQVNGALDGLAFMHSLGLVHGDLKAVRDHYTLDRDIVLTSVTQINILVNELEMPCLGDFGITTMPTATVNFTTMASSKGTLRWMSPELIDDTDDTDSDGLSSSTRCATQKADIWAMAMVIWEVINHSHVSKLLDKAETY